MSTPSSQVLTAYTMHRREARDLLVRYRIAQRKRDPDAFEASIEKSFHEGVHEAYQVRVMDTLTRAYGNQQNVADALGLKHSSSISKMKSSKRIDGVKFTRVLYHHPEITFPTQELATLFGLARAAAHTRAIASEDPSFEGALTVQDCSYVIGLLANPQWYLAIQSKDYDKIRSLAVQIVRERTIPLPSSIRTSKVRPEQLVLMLQQLALSWSDFVIIALYIIHELIPTGKEA